MFGRKYVTLGVLSVIPALRRLRRRIAKLRPA
jgi:hypothetical protein